MPVSIPPRRGKPHVWPAKTIVDPGMGLNNVISDEYIQDQEASDLLNVKFVEAGNPAKRDGISPVGTGLVNNPKGLASFYAVNGSTTNRYLITVDGTSIKYLNGTVWTALTGATQTTGLNTTFTQARSNLFIMNGTDPARMIDVTLTLTSPTTTPSGSFSIYYSGYHIMAGTSSNPNRLYVSDPSDASLFTTSTAGSNLPNNSTDVPGASSFAVSSSAQFIDISKNDGDKITGLAKFQSVLIVFKERSTWQVTFDTNGKPTVVQISAAIGCVSHRSIDAVENDVFFLSRNGYYTLGYEANYINVIRTNELSARIHPVIESITAANLPRTAAIFDTYTFYASIPTGGTTANNKTIVYDRRYGAFSIWTGVNANAWTIFIDSSNIKHLYYAADDTNQVYELVTGQYNDNGSIINSYWSSKAVNFGDFSLTKQILYIDIEFRVLSGSVTVNVLTDGGALAKSSAISSNNDLSGTVGSDLWGDYGAGGGTYNTTTTGILYSSAATAGTGNTANVPYRIQVNKPSRTVKLQISNANLNESFTLLGFTIYFRPYAQSKFDSSHKLT